MWKILTLPKVPWLSSKRDARGGSRPCSSHSFSQEFLEGQADFEGIDGEAGSQEDAESMSFDASDEAGKDLNLDEQGIWKEMQRILHLEERGRPDAGSLDQASPLLGEDDTEDDLSPPGSTSKLAHSRSTNT